MIFTPSAPPVASMWRCPWSRLTHAQARALSCLCLGTKAKVPHGIYRSLVIRGLLTGEYTLTQAGIAALAACRFYSEDFRKCLVARCQTPPAIAQGRPRKAGRLGMGSGA